jgi:hypothetical protein
MRAREPTKRRTSMKRWKKSWDETIDQQIAAHLERPTRGPSRLRADLAENPYVSIRRAAHLGIRWGLIADEGEKAIRKRNARLIGYKKKANELAEAGEAFLRDLRIDDIGSILTRETARLDYTLGSITRNRAACSIK